MVLGGVFGGGAFAYTLFSSRLPAPGSLPPPVRVCVCVCLLSSFLDEGQKAPDHAQLRHAVLLCRTQPQLCLQHNNNNDLSHAFLLLCVGRTASSAAEIAA